ncbi:hypothetical protein OWS73_14760 [Burkholderia sp. 1B3(2022)]
MERFNETPTGRTAACELVDFVFCVDEQLDLVAQLRGNVVHDGFE